MRIPIPVIAILLLFAASALGQQDFQDYVESQKQEYTRFRKQEDKDFHRFLKKDWEAFRMMSGEKEDPHPKPDRIPEAPLPEEEDTSPAPEPEDREPPAQPSDESLTPAESPQEPQPEPSAPSEEPEGSESVAVALLGHNLTFQIDPDWQELSPKGNGKEGISNFWKEFAALDSAPILEQLEHYREELALGDWGMLLLTNRLARSVAEQANEGNTARLLTWGWLLKAGRDVRVALDDRDVVLLYHCRHEVFQVPYFRLQGSRYYVFGQEEPSSITTYQGDYEGAKDALDISGTGRFTARGPQVERELEFQFRDRTYRVELSIPKARIRFLDTVPQLPLRLYFEAHPGRVVTENLVQQLQETISGMQQREAVNFLLRFAQKAFSYQKDSEQFGEENYLYPEETLFYPASDCEDRVILFATLMRRVLGLDLAVLDYPGHVASALDIPRAGDDARVTVDGRDLIVADPTYINAGLGMIMPEFANERPNVLPLWKLPGYAPEG